MAELTHFSPGEAGNKQASAGSTITISHKDLSDKHGVKVSFRVSSELFKALEAEAEAKGYTNLSGYIRRILEARK